MSAKKIMIFVLILTTIAVFSGCSKLSEIIDSTGTGSITGTISGDGDVTDSVVWVIKEDPETLDSPDDTTIIATTTVGDAQGGYTFSNVDTGTYYVVAYKDLNGNGKLDMSPDGPVDPAGFYCDQSQNAIPVIVEKDKTTTGINFEIMSATGTISISGQLTDIEGVNLGEAVTIDFYGTLGTVVATTTTSSSGSYSIDIFPGEYSLVISDQPVSYLPTRTFYFNFEYDSTDIDLPLIGTNDAAGIGYESGETLAGGDVNDGNNNTVPGASVSLTPSTGETGYFDSEGIDWTATETTTEGSFAIRNGNPGEYTITASKSGYTFDEYTIELVADYLTYGKIFGNPVP